MSNLFDFATQHSDRCRFAFEEALRVCEMLRQAGHVAYFAGGCVRDALLQRAPKDFDVATDATPDRVREVFGRKRTLAFGASFGVIAVLPNRQLKQHAIEPTEVATFRSDGNYSDGRRPDKVHFGDAENDALRRDFTINGLFYDPSSSQVIDFVGGQMDLREKRLATIGHATDRFEEDKLRMLRAVRFATTLQFSLSDESFDEIKKRSEEITLVSSERIGAEMRRVITSDHVADGIQLLFDCDLQPLVFPGIEEPRLPTLQQRINQQAANPFAAALAIVLISLSEDPIKSLQTLTQCWRLSNEESRQTKFAIRHWAMISQCDQHPWSVVQPILIDRDSEIAVNVADRITAADCRPREGVDRAREALRWERSRLDPPPLLSGDLLKDAGLKPGPNFRTWLEQVRKMQLDGEISSSDEAIAFVRSQC